MNAMNAAAPRMTRGGNDDAQKYSEGSVARSIEHYTAQAPSDWFLWAAGASILGSLAELAADGRLSVPIVATFPLDQVREAYALLDQGHTHGKIVLLPAGEA